MTLFQAEVPMDGEILLKRSKFLIATLSATNDKSQLAKLSDVTLALLDGQATAILDILVKDGALTVLTLRLMGAFSSGQSITEGSHYCGVIALLLSCERSTTNTFMEDIGLQLVSVVFDFLGESNDKPSSSIDKLAEDKVEQLSIRVAALPWSNLPTRKRELLIRLLQKVLRESLTKKVCAAALFFLSELADEERQKRLMVESPGLVEDVLEKASFWSGAEPGDSSTRILLLVCRLLRRLAWGANCKATLSEKKNLDRVLLESSESDEFDVKEEALSIISQMSTDPTSRRRIASRDDFVLIKRLVDLLHVPLMRRAALVTLTSLTDGHTAKQIASSQDVVTRLSTLMMSGEETIASKAAQMLKRIACHLALRDSGHHELLEALISGTTSSSSSVRTWAIKGILAQSEISTNSFYIVRSPAVLKVIIALTADPIPNVRKVALQALLNVARDASNTKRAASTAKFLDAFVRNATERIDREDEASLETTRLAINGLLHFSDHPKSCHRVAKQKGAIEALARYGVSNDTDADLQNAALHAVVVLSPLM
jgi:hypothetical protein